jgi:hypothetical protein
MRCGIHVKDNKLVGASLYLFHKYLDTSVFLILLFLLILFGCVIPAVPRTTCMKLTDH